MNKFIRNENDIISFWIFAEHNLFCFVKEQKMNMLIPLDFAKIYC